MPAWWNWPFLAIPPLHPQPQEGLCLLSASSFPTQPEASRAPAFWLLRCCPAVIPDPSPAHTKAHFPPPIPCQSLQADLGHFSCQSGLPMGLEEVQPQPCCLPAVLHRLCSLSCSPTALARSWNDLSFMLPVKRKLIGTLRGRWRGEWDTHIETHADQSWKTSWNSPEASIQALLWSLTPYSDVTVRD